MQPFRLVSAGFIDAAGKAVWTPHALDITAAGLVGRAAELSAAPATQLPVIDVEGFVMPGLVNWHSHAPMIALRGLVGAAARQDWLRAVWRFEDLLTEEDVQLAALAAFGEMLLHGITTSVEMYFHDHAVLAAAETAGLRCCLTPGVNEAPNFLRRFGSSRRQLGSALDIASEARGKSRISVGLSVHSAYTVTETMFMTACEAARETGCLFHFHWAEFPADQELRDWRQNSFSDAMRSSGICQVNALAAHGVNLSARDWANIHDWDLRVALCARSNVALSVGLPRVPEFCRGTTTRFGTDGSHDAPVDIFQSAKPLTGLNEDAGVPWSYNSVLHTALATADRLGFRHPIGKLAPGYLADIVTIKPGPGAQADIASGGTLDVSALDWDGSVCDVWVGGVRVVAAGQVLTFDTEATYARLALIRRRLLATG